MQRISGALSAKNKVSVTTDFRKGATEMDNNTYGKDHDVLPGVQCSVESCIYHCCDNCCAAPGINVRQEATNCSCSSETLCSTFEPHP